MANIQLFGNFLVILQRFLKIINQNMEFTSKYNQDMLNLSRICSGLPTRSQINPTNANFTI